MARGLVIISAVKLLHNVHALGDFSEWREAILVQTRVVAKIDEHLRRPRVLSSHGVRDAAGDVALRHGIVLYIRVGPSLVNRGAAGQAELDDEIGHHAEQARAVVKVILHEIVEAIGSQWRPGARYL